jgi:hypothetical protein
MAHAKCLVIKPAELQLAGMHGIVYVLCRGIALSWAPHIGIVEGLETHYVELALSIRLQVFLNSGNSGERVVVAYRCRPALFMSCLQGVA